MSHNTGQINKLFLHIDASSLSSLNDNQAHFCDAAAVDQASVIKLEVAICDEILQCFRGEYFQTSVTSLHVGCAVKAFYRRLNYCDMIILLDMLAE